MEILKIEGLCKKYPAFSLKNVTFSMESGTVMGFIGRNGAGKSTLLSLICAYNPQSYACDIVLFGKPRAKRRRSSRCSASCIRMQVMWRSAGWTSRNRSWRSRHRSAS